MMTKAWFEILVALGSNSPTIFHRRCASHLKSTRSWYHKHVRATFEKKKGRHQAETVSSCKWSSNGRQDLYIFSCKKLLEKWAWGSMSTQEVQEMAALSVKDFASMGHAAPQDFEFLASLGCTGQYKNNMHRELLAWADSRCQQMVQPFFQKIDFKEPWGRQLQSFLLPHEIFATLYHNYNSFWKQIMLPSVQLLKDFWSLQEKHPALPEVKECAGYQANMIPLAFHGDGTPVVGIGKIWSRQVTIFSINGMLGHGPTKDQQPHVWSTFDETMSDKTLPQFFHLWAWSLK